jgi:hypothetical protein
VLYGLKQAPRAWCECPKNFFLKNAFEIGKVDSLSSFEEMEMISSYAKFMSMTLSLGLLMISFVKSLIEGLIR